MACCDKGNEYQTVVVWIEKSGSTMRVYLRNQGRNTVMIQRINLCFTDKTGPGYGAIYWRPEKNVEFLEAYDWPVLFVELDLTGSNIGTMQAQVEYIEVDGRSTSCVMKF